MRTLLFDTETTSLVGNSVQSERHQPRIIEFYGHIIEPDGTIVEQLEFLCKPPFAITEEITQITGIKNADLDDAKPFSHYAHDVLALFAHADEMVAHNLPYDMFVTETELRRIHLWSPEVYPKARTCTVEATEYIMGYRLSLTALHQHLFGEPFDGAHRAREDVAAMTRCFLELRRRDIV